MAFSDNPVELPVDCITALPSIFMTVYVQCYKTCRKAVYYFKMFKGNNFIIQREQLHSTGILIEIEQKYARLKREG